MSGRFVWIDESDLHCDYTKLGARGIYFATTAVLRALGLPAAERSET